MGYPFLTSGEMDQLVKTLIAAGVDRAEIDRTRRRGTGISVKGATTRMNRIQSPSDDLTVTTS